MEKIRNLFLPLVCTLFIAGFSSCDDELLDITFNYNDTEVEFTVDSTSQTGTASTKEQTIRMNLDSVLKANGVDKSKVKSLKLQSLTLEIIDPDTATFDPLESFSGYIKTDNLPAIEIASKGSIPDEGLQTLKLEVKSDNLLPYLEEESFDFYGTITTTEPVPAPITINADFDFSITGQAL